MIFEDPLLFWTGEGEVTEWDQEDAYGSMKGEFLFHFILFHRDGC